VKDVVPLSIALRERGFKSWELSWEKYDYPDLCSLGQIRYALNFAYFTIGKI
jgi:hypothetical protein